MNLITFDAWFFLGLVALIGLVIYFRKREAWGGLILGVFVGFAIAFVNMAKGSDFNYNYVKIATIIGTLVGLIFSFITRIRNKEKLAAHNNRSV